MLKEVFAKNAIETVICKRQAPTQVCSIIDITAKPAVQVKPYRTLKSVRSTS